ncbi:OmpA family protein [Azonexus sp. IMCC34839]|uniref:OmpA family protein n=1 Tax=Azonexus sp. IMCC34839 TaxID=3133695 RepID=UPI00399A7547
MQYFSFKILTALSLLTLAGCAAQKPVVETPKATGSVQTAAAEPTQPPTEATRTEAQVIAAVDVPNSVFFARGSVEIDAAGKAALRAHAERLKDNPKLRVVLIGYTDDLGSRSYNLAIADRRVHAVYGELRRLGVQAMQMKRSSMGMEKLSKSCVSEDCRRLMRRVEIDYRD